jgi:hypothetical protein
LDAASIQTSDAWAGFMSDLGQRGLRSPLLAISDSAAGLVGAVERAVGAAATLRSAKGSEPEISLSRYFAPPATRTGDPRGG